MTAIHLSLGIAKFQRCSVLGCGRDAVDAFRAQTKDKNTFHFGICAKADHKESLLCMSPGCEQKTITQLIQGATVDKETIFIQPAGIDWKCRWLGWKDSKKKGPTQRRNGPDGEAEVVAFRVYPSWEWIRNYRRWMDVEGQLVSLRKLSVEEFVSSAVALREANYLRVTKRVSWVSLLVFGERRYLYPRKEMEVGSALAGDKLDEFKEEAETRGLL